MIFDTLTDIVGGVDIDSQSKQLTDAFETYLERDDIDNGETNHILGETINVFPKYAPVAMFCGVPMDSGIQRRAFSSVYKYGNFIFLNYLAGYTHSINALLPYKLRFARTDDLFKTYEELPIKCINDGGTMREIEPYTDEFMPYMSSFAYAGGKLWAVFATLNITTNPPVTGNEWEGGKTYATYSEDFGDTWSELITVDNDCYFTNGIDILVVGNELWIPSYSLSQVTVADQHSYILRLNYVTESPGTKTQMDSAWTGLSTTEPTILEYATGKYMSIARVNWNANYSGQETQYKGEVIAYSTDGLDWSNYTWHDAGTNYPNTPHLFKYKDIVYYFRNHAVIHGTVSGDETQIDWILKASYGGYWWVDYASTFRQMYATIAGGWIERYDPRVGYEDQLQELYPAGGANLCVYDEDTDTLVATRAFKLDGGPYIGEPWIAIVKRCSVGTGPTYTERLIYATEIPGDSHTSNTITIWNDYVSAGDTVIACWYNMDGQPECEVTAVTYDYGIVFTSSEAVTQGRIIYEIIKP
jgi:hypothetical protein